MTRDRRVMTRASSRAQRGAIRRVRHRRRVSLCRAGRSLQPDIS